MAELADKSKEFARQLKKDFPRICYPEEPLHQYTTYRVGGPADALVIPDSIEQLEQIVRRCLRQNVPFFILGKGSNILVHDSGYRGVVILLEKCCSQLFHQDTLLYVGAGVTVKDLVTYCEAHGLSGLDFMSGIPGTVGGALIMNAGAFEGEIGDRVLRIDAIDERGVRIQISREEAQFGYRCAQGLVGKILLGCWLLLEPGDSRKLADARKKYLQRRENKQPLDYPSCGSVFKRPPGDYAGRLIEACGCKGMRIGGAEVSPKHANFIINVGGATAQDIFSLICQVQRKVYDRFGVWLEPEVKFIGFPEQELKQLQGPAHG